MVESHSESHSLNVTLCPRVTLLFQLHEVSTAHTSISEHGRQFAQITDHRIGKGIRERKHIQYSLFRLL